MSIHEYSLADIETTYTNSGTHIVIHPYRLTHIQPYMHTYTYTDIHTYTQDYTHTHA